jgi:hypothetical protein
VNCTKQKDVNRSQRFLKDLNVAGRNPPQISCKLQIINKITWWRRRESNLSSPFRFCNLLILRTEERAKRHIQASPSYDYRTICLLKSRQPIAISLLRRRKASPAKCEYHLKTGQRRVPGREAKRIESFTETKLRTNARAIQLAPTIFQTSRIKASGDSNLAGSG